MAILNMLHNLLGGSSPITGYLGSAIIVMDVVYQAVIAGGIPHDLAGWLQFAGGILTGLALRFAKDVNKSNAPSPTSTPTTVP